MNHEMDERIRSLTNQSDVQIPQNFDMEVTRILNGLNEEIRLGWFLPFKQAIAMCAALVFVFSISTYAAANYVMQRMETMYENEKKSYIDSIQYSGANADSYSRKLTAEEGKNLELLKIQYKSKGRFPKGQILQIASENDVPKDTLCFVTASSMFYFPEREMTDEELLEFIDFYYKRDYSITEASSEQVNENVVAVDGATADSAVEIAGQLLRDVYEIDIEQEDYTVEFMHYDSAIMDDTYWVTVKKASLLYCVSINAKSNLILSLQCFDKSEDIPEVTIDEKLYSAPNKQVTNLVLSSIIPEAEINQAFLEYQYDSNGMLLNGIITYYFEIDTGVAYSINYDVSNQTIQTINFLENHSDIKKILQQKLEYCKTHGLVQKVIDL